MTDAEDKLRSLVKRIESANADIDACNRRKAALYKDVRALGFDPRTLKPLPIKTVKPKSVRELVFQPPRPAGMFEQRLAYRKGQPISQDFAFQNACIYFLAFHELGRIKIGITNNLDQRKRCLERACGASATLIHSRPGNTKAEAAFHQQFAKWRINGEWFSLNPTTMEMVSKIAHVRSQEAA